jgi:dTDP-4-amino-4,6-dideoxygalactose transaminase
VTGIPLSRSPVDDEIKQAVLAAIDTRQYVLGPHCREFESELARHIGTTHAVLTRFLKQRGIQTGVHYPVPRHRQPAVQWLAAPALPETERLGHEILSLPISADHTEAEIDEIAAAVREFFAG